LLCYALMYQKQHQIEILEAGIITFKNLNSGLQKFILKDRNGSKGKNHLVDSEVLEQFSFWLKKLISEICAITIPFTEKEV